MDSFSSDSAVKKLLEYYFRVEDLQNVLKSFNLPINGRKSELLERVLSLINSRQYEPEFIIKVKQKIKQEYQLRVAKTNVALERIKTPFDDLKISSNKHSTKNKASKNASSKSVKENQIKGAKCYEYDTDYSCLSDSSDSLDTTTQTSVSDDSDSDRDRDWNLNKHKLIKKVNGFIRDGIAINSKNSRKNVPKRKVGKIASKKINKSSRKRPRRIITSFTTSEDSSSDECPTKKLAKKNCNRICSSSSKTSSGSGSSSSSSSDMEMDHRSVDRNKNEKSLPQTSVANENNKNLCNNKANEKSDANTVVMEIDDDSDDDIQIIEVVNKPVSSSVVTDNQPQPPQSQPQPHVEQQPPSIDSITSDSNFTSQEDSLDDYDNIATPNMNFTTQDDAIEKLDDIPLCTDPLPPICTESLPPIRITISNQNTVTLNTCDTNLNANTVTLNTCDTNLNATENISENVAKVVDNNADNNCGDNLKDDLEEGELVEDIKPLLPVPKPFVPQIIEKEEVIPKQLPYEGVLDCFKPQIIMVNIPKLDVKPDMPALPHCVSMKLIDPQVTLSQIKELVSDSDAEIEALDKNLRLSLICPITNRRISIPGRSSTCEHFDCFDVLPFIVLNSKKVMDKWRCPKCKQSAPLHMLIIDGLVKHILITTEETCEAVVFDQNVIWRPESNKHDTDHSTEKLDHSVVDLVELDDDDDDKEVQKNEPTLTIEAAKQLANTLRQRMYSETTHTSSTNNVQLNYNTQTKQIHFIRQQPSNIFQDLITAAQPSVQPVPPVQQRAVPQQQPPQRTAPQQQSTQRTAQPLPHSQKEPQSKRDYRDLLSSVLSARPKPKEIPLEPVNRSNSRENVQPKQTRWDQRNNVANPTGSVRNVSATISPGDNARRPILAPSVVKAASAVTPKRYLMDHIAILGNDLITKNGDVLRKAGQLYCELCCVPLGYHRTETHTNKNVDCHVKGSNHQSKLKTLKASNDKSVNSNQTSTTKVNANTVPIGTTIINNVSTQSRPQPLSTTATPNASVFQTQSTFLIPEPNQHNQHMPSTFIQYNNFSAGNYGLQTFIPQQQQQNKSQYNPPSAPPPAHQRAAHTAHQIPPNNYQSNNYADYYYFPPNFAHQFNSYYPNYNSNQYHYNNNRQT